MMKKNETKTYCRIVNELNGYAVQNGIAILITVLLTIIKAAAPTATERLQLYKIATRSLKKLRNVIA